MVQVGELGGLGAARIDHHQAPAALLQVLEPVRDVRRRHDAAVRHHRVAAHAQEKLRAIDVRHREQHLVAEHLERREHVGKLIDGRGRVTAACAQRLDERQAEEDRAIVVDGGIAEIEAHRILAVSTLDLLQPARDLVERLVPADPLPAGGGATHRPLEPIRVLVDVLQADGFGTDVPARERVVLVAADGEHLLALVVDGDPAHCFAQVASTVVSLSHERLQPIAVRTAPLLVHEGPLRLARCPEPRPLRGQVNGGVWDGRAVGRREEICSSTAAGAALPPPPKPAHAGRRVRTACDQCVTRISRSLLGCSGRAFIE